MNVFNVRWLICRNEDASKKIFVATGILVFDFELFIGGRVQQFLTARSERWCPDFLCCYNLLDLCGYLCYNKFVASADKDQLVS